MLDMNKKIYYMTTKREKRKIYPFFLPFFGCPQICTFCNQSLQTGREAFSSSQLQALLDNAYKDLKLSFGVGEFAFYGGTFSGLPEEDFEYCLDFIVKCKKEGLIEKARCSTRPDACSDTRLYRMKEKGIDTIELGIQSFKEKALLMSNRGYTPEIAYNACKQVQAYGFTLGIQLLPNLPGQEENEFLSDVLKAIEIKPDFMRFYPCLVVENTILAREWKANRHRVWSFETTVELLAKALYKTWQAQIPLIRIGVAYEENFYAHILAGVQHPALGQLVQEKAAQIVVEKIAKDFNIEEGGEKYIWHFPLSAKGFLKFKKDKEFWSKYNIESPLIQWHEEHRVYLSLEER